MEGSAAHLLGVQPAAQECRPPLRFLHVLKLCRTQVDGSGAYVSWERENLCKPRLASPRCSPAIRKPSTARCPQGWQPAHPVSPLLAHPPAS